MHRKTVHIFYKLRIYPKLCHPINIQHEDEFFDYKLAISTIRDNEHRSCSVNLAHILNNENDENYFTIIIYKRKRHYRIVNKMSLRHTKGQQVRRDGVDDTGRVFGWWK